MSEQTELLKRRLVSYYQSLLKKLDLIKNTDQSLTHQSFDVVPPLLPIKSIKHTYHKILQAS